MSTAGNPGNVIWDLGRVPYDPDDCYTAQLLSCLSQITEGVTCGTDTSQANHTPAHTDAMIKGMMDSGRRMVFDYSGGIDRSADGFPYEVPGAMNDTTKGIGRIAKTYFSSKDQLVTLGFGGGPGPAFPGASYTGWQLGRSFGALINNHNVGNAKLVIDAAADPRNGTDWSDVTFVHATRWQDNPYAQLSADSAGYPNPGRSRAWEIVRDRGAHVSIANLIEMQMRHGMPPLQEALNHGILPSLSPDVDTNMTTDPFSLMRGAYCLQRALANDLAFRESNPGNLPVPQLVTSRQVIEMATIAGAAANRLHDKVGTLTPGKEADIVVLDARSINTWPMNNVPGTIVTMMNPRHVRDVLIAGKVVYWKRTLVGWDVDRLLRQAEQARDRVLARINGPAKVGALPTGNNSDEPPLSTRTSWGTAVTKGRTPRARVCAAALTTRIPATEERNEWQIRCRRGRLCARIDQHGTGLALVRAGACDAGAEARVRRPGDSPANGRASGPTADFCSALRHRAPQPSVQAACSTASRVRC